MKSFLVITLLFTSLSAFAKKAIYHCQNLQKLNGSSSEKLIIKESWYEDSLELIEKINFSELEDVEEERNPFADFEKTESYQVDIQAVKEASQLSFKKVTSTWGRVGIYISESIANYGINGYAYYSSSSGIIDRSIRDYYFYCEKR